MPPELKALIDPDTAEVLRRINGLSPYETPDLRLKHDTVYANTPADYEPFGAIKPYKEHFLKQMEYTGPGRAIPEPGPDLKSVKIGFIGPIMSTVSVATGGKSHEEALGIKMLQGAQLAIEESNARGGYLRRNIPFELVSATTTASGAPRATRSSTWPTRTRSGPFSARSTAPTATSPSAWRSRPRS